MKSPSSHADHASVSHTEDLRPMPIETRLNAAFNAAGTTTSDLVTDFNELVQTSNFKDFMMKSTRIMERALSAESSVDIFKDYRVGNNSGAKIRSLKDSLIIPRAVFESSIVKGNIIGRRISIHPCLFLKRWPISRSVRYEYCQPCDNPYALTRSTCIGYSNIIYLS